MEKGKFVLSVPMAIIIAGAMIAVAVFINKTPTPAQNLVNQDKAPAEINIKAVTKDDHILGDLDAPLLVVEYSDSECPFCKVFHQTMQQLKKDYGEKITWVYRSFPIESLHPTALKEAEAFECATELGGNDVFWKYADRLFEVTPSNNGLDPATLPDIAEYSGLNKEDFKACLDSGKYAQKVSDDVQEAIVAGAQGTPYTVVISKDGEKTVISGAQPISTVKKTLDSLLK